LGEDKMAEPIRVGINGFGVMGRYLLRALQKDVSSGKLAPGMVEVVAVNDMYPVSQLFPLLEHDSTYLGFPGKLETDGKDILVDGEVSFVDDSTDNTETTFESMENLLVGLS